MTKQDYEIIAGVIKGLPMYPTKKVVAKRFATRLEYDNPRFNRERFLKACESEAETGP